MIEELGFKLGDKVVDKQTGFTGQCVLEGLHKRRAARLSTRHKQGGMMGVRIPDINSTKGGKQNG